MKQTYPIISTLYNPYNPHMFWKKHKRCVDYVHRQHLLSMKCYVLVLHRCWAKWSGLTLETMVCVLNPIYG